MRQIVEEHLESVEEMLIFVLENDIADQIDYYMFQKLALEHILQKYDELGI